MRPRRVVAALHLSEPSGPSRSLAPVLEHLAADASVLVAVPARGRAGAELGGFARVEATGHEPVILPRRPREAAALGRRLRHETRRFRALLRRHRADLAIAATTTVPAFVLAARLEGVPSIVYANELYRHGLPGDAVRYRAGIATLRANERLATVIVPCSHAVASELRPATRCVVMYPPIVPPAGGGDAEAFRREHGIPATGPIVATLGNVGPARGQDVAVRALAAVRRTLPGAQLVIAGAPHPRDADRAFAAGLRALARRLGLADAVHFCGFVEGRDLFAACDVVLNPARAAESFGMVAMEALLAGRPVVSTAVGAVPEVLENERHALLVAPEDPEAIAAAVRRVVEDRALAERLVAAGRAHVREAFSPDRQLARFERAMQMAMASSCAAGAR